MAKRISLEVVHSQDNCLLHLALVSHKDISEENILDPKQGLQAIFCERVPWPKNEELAPQHVLQTWDAPFLLSDHPGPNLKSRSKALLHPDSLCWDAEDAQTPSHQDLTDTEWEMEPLK